MWGSNEKKAEPFRPGEQARPGEAAKSAGPEKPGASPSKTQPPNWEAKSMAMNTNEPMYPSTTSSGAAARLGASLHVKGEITGNEDLSVDGSVEGLIQLEDRKLTVGASAKVTADIIAREVVVYGNVKGNLRARDRIEIKKDGSVVGDLTTARIMIEDGAYFKGSIEIDKTGDASGNVDKSYSRTGAGSGSNATKTAVTSSD
ncbi:MAG: bactofilin family protein [Candidatus Acidiferrales bacterium]